MAAPNNIIDSAGRDDTANVINLVWESAMQRAASGLIVTAPNNKIDSAGRDDTANVINLNGPCSETNQCMVYGSVINMVWESAMQRAASGLIVTAPNNEIDSAGRDDTANVINLNGPCSETNQCMVYGSVININMVWESAMQRAASGLPRDST